MRFLERHSIGSLTRIHLISTSQQQGRKRAFRFRVARFAASGRVPGPTAQWLVVSASVTRKIAESRCAGVNGFSRVSTPSGRSRIISASA